MCPAPRTTAKVKGRQAIQSPDDAALPRSFHLTVTCIKQCPAIGFRGISGGFFYGRCCVTGFDRAARPGGPKLDHGINPLQGIIYFGVVAAGVLFVAYSIYSDIDATRGSRPICPMCCCSSRC
jgi:hypothetical protein